MRLVLDASAAVRVVMRAEHAPGLLKTLAGAAVVTAPSLFSSEVANALWKYIQAGTIPLETAVERYEEAVSLVDDFTPDGAGDGGPGRSGSACPPGVRPALRGSRAAPRLRRPDLGQAPLGAASGHGHFGRPHVVLCLQAIAGDLRQSFVERRYSRRGAGTQRAKREILQNLERNDDLLWMIPKQSPSFDSCSFSAPQRLCGKFFLERVQ